LPWRLLRSRLQRLRPRTQLEWNAFWLYADVAFAGVIQGGAIAFLPIYVVRMGGTPALVSLLTALPALTTAAACLVMGSLVQRTRRLVPLQALGWGLYRCTYLLMALLPFFHGLSQPIACVVLWTVASVPLGLGVVAFSTLLAEATTLETRARVISVRMVIFQLIAAVTGYAAGRTLDWIPFPNGYQIIFASGFVFGMASVVCSGRIRLPDLPATEGRTLTVGQRFSLAERFRVLRQMGGEGREFLRFQGAASWMRLGMSLPAALFSIYWVNYAHASDSWIGLLTMSNQLLGIVGYYLWGRIAARRGDRRVLVLGSLLTCVYPALHVLVRTPAALLPVMAIGGFAGAGYDIGLTDTLYLVSPAKWRPQLIALNGTLTYLFIFVGPMAGAALSQWLGIAPALLIAACLRLSGGVLFYLLGTGRALRPLAAAEGGANG
jgi:MFS family permease